MADITKTLVYNVIMLDMESPSFEEQLNINNRNTIFRKMLIIVSESKQEGRTVVTGLLKNQFVFVIILFTHNAGGTMATSNFKIEGEDFTRIIECVEIIDVFGIDTITFCRKCLVIECVKCVASIEEVTGRHMNTRICAIRGHFDETRVNYDRGL